MKTKKILFTTSGILKIIISAFGVLIFALVLLLSGMLKETLLSDVEALNEMMNELVAIDSSYAYILEMSSEEFVNYIMNMLNTLSIFVLLMCISGIVLGIFNLVFAKKYDTMLAHHKGKKIIFMIVNLICYWGVVTNVLTIIALWLKDEQKIDNNQILVN